MSAELQRLLQRYPVLSACERELSAAFIILENAFSAGNKLLVCGNGGSASDSEHIVGELLKGFLHSRPIAASETAKLEQTAGTEGAAIAAKLQAALPAISLVSQTSLITAVSNDTSGDMIFAKQVYGLVNRGCAPRH